MGKRMLYFFAGIALLCWIGNLLVALNVGHNNSNLLGDAFGMTNSLFSFFAFVGVLYSLFQQRSEQEKRNLENFENTFFKMLDQLQSISNGTTFTKLHRMSEVIGGFQNTIYSGTEYFTFAFKELLAELGRVWQPEIILYNNGYEPVPLLPILLKDFPLDGNKSKIELISSLFQDEVSIDESVIHLTKDEIRKYIEIVYEPFQKKHTDNLDHFYRCLNNVFKYIV